MTYPGFSCETDSFKSNEPFFQVGYILISQQPDNINLSLASVTHASEMETGAINAMLLPNHLYYSLVFHGELPSFLL